MAEYTVTIETVLQLAKDCYAIANNYADVTSKISRVDDAVGHLTDKDGAATAADTDVVALVDEFFEYLKTTSSRYYLAAEQLETSAGNYVNVEDAQKATFDRTMSDWDSYEGSTNDVRDYSGADWNPTEEADETERPEGTTEHASGFSTTENPGNQDQETGEYIDNLDDSQGGN